MLRSALRRTHPPIDSPTDSLPPELAAVHDNVLDAPLSLHTVLHSAQIHMPPDLEDLCLDLLRLAPSDRPTASEAVHRAVGPAEGRAARRDRMCAALRATFSPQYPS